MPSFRTEKTSKKYALYREKHRKDTQCSLCSKIPLKKFTYWKIVRNSFPYDAIAKQHQMIVPMRHTTEESLTKSELAEFQKIKRDLLNLKYDFIIEGTTKKKTIPAHFHQHLLVAR